MTGSLLPLRVLLVEDSDLAIRHVQIIVDQVCPDAHLETAHTVTDARLMLRQPWDIVLLDLTLVTPGDGWDVAKMLRRNSDPELVILTSSNDEQSVLRAHQGRGRFLSKPLTPVQLETVVWHAREVQRLRRRRITDRDIENDRRDADR